MSEQALRNEFLKLIAQEETHPQKLYPMAVWKIQRTYVFRNYYNRLDGWFVWVQYTDGLFEIWFIVDVSSSLSDDDWYLEKVT